MEAHIIEIIRFSICIIATLIAVMLMIKADDNSLMRRLSVVFAVLVIYFNKRIGIMFYLLIGSFLETLMVAMGVAFVVILCVVIMIFPLVALFRWVIH